MRQLQQSDNQFTSQLSALLTGNKLGFNQNPNLSQKVSTIITQVQNNGLSALLDYTQQFDHWQPKKAADLIFDYVDCKKAFDSLGKKDQALFEQIRQRIIDYHNCQKIESFDYFDTLGNQLGQIVRPIESVGVYVPGGSAAYPSSVLMSALVAKVAGVKHITMMMPTPNNQINSSVLACAYLSGVDVVYRLGGAQAIAALAYGTDSIKKVDMIVGPGNIYVAEAKRQVFGQVAIDMIAGPSELTILADKSANPQWVALDLFAQAEHDSLAQAILITDSADLIVQVKKQIDLLLDDQPRKSIIAKALQNQGAFILANSIDDAISIVNQIAPEHLQLSCQNSNQVLKQIKNAGAIFVGHLSCEVVGDYCAGPSHVLPTAGSSRFSSPLSVYDFLKRTSVINCSEKGSFKLNQMASQMAEKESLFAHRDSAKARVNEAEK